MTPGSGRAAVRSATPAILALAAIVGLGGFLVLDSFAEGRRLVREEERLEELEARVAEDPLVAESLADLRRRRTVRSLDRRQRQERWGWGLLGLTALFLVSVPRRRAGDPVVEDPDSVLEGLRSARERLEEGGGLPRRRAGAALAGLESAEVEARLGTIVQRVGGGRESAIGLLQAVQAEWGYLPDEVMRRLIDTTAVTPGQLVGNATFYAGFRREPRGRFRVRVCHGTACHVAGIRPVVEELERRLEIPAGADTDPDRRFTLEPVACLGCCSLAPVLMVEEETVGRLTPTAAWATLRSWEESA